MNAQQIAETMALHQTEARMERLGLIVERSALSASHRRALTALERLVASHAPDSGPVRDPIGVAYPTAR